MTCYSNRFCGVFLIWFDLYLIIIFFKFWFWSSFLITFIGSMCDLVGWVIEYGWQKLHNFSGISMRLIFDITGIFVCCINLTRFSFVSFFLIPLYLNDHWFFWTSNSFNFTNFFLGYYEHKCCMRRSHPEMTVSPRNGPHTWIDSPLIHIMRIYVSCLRLSHQECKGLWGCARWSTAQGLLFLP